MGFTNTKRALEDYDSYYKRTIRGELYRQIKTDADVKEWETVAASHLQEVRDAFFEDTKNFNSRDNCNIVGIDYMRKLCK